MSLDDWSYKLQHGVTSATTLTDYQVKIRIYRTTGTNSGSNIYVGSKCLTNYNDLRFVDSDDTTLLPYWIETYSSSYADVWIKVPTINTTSYIYIYYGNASASSLSNGDATFVFFDDFPGTSLDTTTKWTVSAGSTPTVSANTATLSSYSIIQNKTAFTSNVVVEYKLKSTSAGTVKYRFGKYISGSGEGGIFDNLQIWWNSGYTGVYTAINTWYDCKETWLLGTSFNWIITGVYNNTGSTSYTSGYAYFRNGDSAGSFVGSFQIQQVKVRAYAATEPTQTPSTETSLQSPLTGWTYKQSHVITLPTTDYQVMFTLNYGVGTSTGSTIYLNGHANADFGDVRFTNDNGIEIPYWIESYTAATTATVWVKIPTTSTIWIYYGNSDAQTTSNGETTFVFFDDFTGTSLNTSKWSSTLITYNSGTGTISVNNALTLTQTNGADRGVSLRSANALSSDTLTIRTKVNARSAGTSGAQIRLVLNNSSNTDAGVFGLYTPNNGTSYLYNGFGVGNPSFADTFTISSPTIYEWEGRVTNPRAYKDGVLKCTGSGTPTAPAGNYIRIWTYSTTASITLDWICARSYATTEPTHSTWSEEQEVIPYPLRITITPTTGTDPLSVSYNVSISDVLSNFILSYGDGEEYNAATSSAFATTHTYSDPGTYTVWAEGYTEFATHRYYEIPYGVHVSAPAVAASFNIDQNYNIVTFTNTSTGDPNEFFWTFGDGNVSYEQNPSHTYHSAATHLVTLYASNQYQYDVATTNITVNQILTPPEAYFVPNDLNLVNPTLPYTVQFTNYSIPAFGCTYNWVIDSTSYTTEDPSHSFATYGYYDVSLTVTNALGSSTKSYNDAIKISRKGKTLFEVVGCADIFSTFGVEVFDEVATYVDLGIVYATILPESICFVQSEIPDVPGIDEWGVRHLYSTINEWGHRIFTTLNSWGHKIMHNASATDHSPLVIFNAEIFEERIIISDEHQFGTE